jgi:hypothetical protein
MTQSRVLTISRFSEEVLEEPIVNEPFAYAPTDFILDTFLSGWIALGLINNLYYLYFDGTVMVRPRELTLAITASRKQETGSSNESPLDSFEMPVRTHNPHFPRVTHPVRPAAHELASAHCDTARTAALVSLRAAHAQKRPVRSTSKQHNLH